MLIEYDWIVHNSDVTLNQDTVAFTIILLLQDQSLELGLHCTLSHFKGNAFWTLDIHDKNMSVKYSWMHIAKCYSRDRNVNRAQHTLHPKRQDVTQKNNRFKKVNKSALHCMGKTNSINMQCTGVSTHCAQLRNCLVYCYMCMLRVEGY